MFPSLKCRELRESLGQKRHLVHFSALSSHKNNTACRVLLPHDTLGRDLCSIGFLFPFTVLSFSVPLLLFIFYLAPLSLCFTFLLDPSREPSSAMFASALYLCSVLLHFVLCSCDQLILVDLLESSHVLFICSCSLILLTSLLEV